MEFSGWMLLGPVLVGLVIFVIEERDRRWVHKYTSERLAEIEAEKVKRERKG